MARSRSPFDLAALHFMLAGRVACGLAVGYRRLCRALLVFLLACVAIAPAALAAETPLPAATNLSQDAVASARQGMPLIVLVSLTGCQFCEKIRRQHLAPLLASGVRVQQVYLDSDIALTDFGGKTSTQRRFAQALAVKAAPTVFFFDAQGAQLAEPIVGTLIDDFYSAYLDQAIATAKKTLASRS